MQKSATSDPVHAIGASFGDASVSPATTANARPPKAGLTTPVEILEKPRPLYTARARDLRLEGEVLLQVLFPAGEPRVCCECSIASDTVSTRTPLRRRRRSVSGRPLARGSRSIPSRLCTSFSKSHIDLAEPISLAWEKLGTGRSSRRAVSDSDPRRAAVQGKIAHENSQDSFSITAFGLALPVFALFLPDAARG